MADDRDERLAVALRDFEERSARGARPPLVEYREQLGDAWKDFADIVDTEDELKALLEPSGDPPLGGLFGPYELLRLVGRGSTGLVYEARNAANNRLEAVKILRPGLEAEPDSLRRFRREVQLIHDLEHPHIVRVYAGGEIGGYPYCAMEFVSGMSLRDAAVEQRLPSLPELCRGLAGVADALQMLHDRGVVHRDVKPSNLMLRADGSLVLADFGLARAADHQRITWTGQMLGTPNYMSPEQMRGGVVDGRTDVYGLGATLYRVLAGRPPLEGATIAALASKVLDERPLPLARVAPDVPDALSDIVMSALEKQPDDRQSSAAALAGELRAFADFGTRGSSPVSRIRRATRWARRRWPAVTAVAVVLAVAAAFYLHRPARIFLEVLPAGAEVTLNGEKQPAAARLDLRAAPGTWRLQATSEGFVPLDRPLEVEAGEEKELIEVLVVADPNDRVAALRLKDALDAHAVTNAVTAFDDGSRGGADGEIVPVYPRRTCRLVDLQRFRVEVLQPLDERDARSAKVVFKQGDTVLAQRTLPVDAFDHEGEIPSTVRDAVRSGGTVSWGVEAGRHAWLTDFSVASISAQAAARWKIVERLSEKQPAGIRAWLFGSFLSHEGFHVGALQAMRRSGEARKALPPWVVSREALGRLGISETRFGDQIRDAMSAFPEDLLASWTRGP